MKNLFALFVIFGVAVATFGQTKDLMTIKIYLSDGNNNPNFEDCGKVREVSRTIPKTKAVAKAALNELVKGATEVEKARNLSSIFSAETKSIIKSVNIIKNAAYVNLDDWVIENLGTATTSCGAFTFITPIEKTLMQFPSVKRVFFAIEGVPKVFYEWMQVGECPKELKDCDGRNFKNKN